MFVCQCRGIIAEQIIAASGQSLLGTDGRMRIGTEQLHPQHAARISLMIFIAGGSRPPVIEAEHGLIRQQKYRVATSLRQEFHAAVALPGVRLESKRQSAERCREAGDRSAGGRGQRLAGSCCGPIFRPRIVYKRAQGQ